MAETTPSHPTAPASIPEPAERWSKLADTVFHNLSTDQGLPHASVTALAEDANGFLWIGTQGGLTRWDGYRFRTYRPDSLRTDALPATYIRTLHTDRQGRLWIGTVNGGLARYEPDNDRFISYTVSPSGISHVSVRAISDDGAGGIWVATEGGLDRLDPATGNIVHLRHDPKDSGSLPDNRIHALLLEKSGALWVGTRNGLVRRAPDAKGNSGFTAIPIQVKTGQVPAITSLWQSDDGRVWIGSRYGAFVFDPVSGTTQALRDTGVAGSPQLDEWIYRIAEPQTGEIWLGSYTEGIIVVNTRTLRTRRIRHDATLPTSLAHDTVLAMLRDRVGMLWVGTERGIGRHDPRQTTVATVFGPSTRSDGLSSSDVRSVLSMSDGTLWLGLRNNGVDFLDPAGVRIGGLRRGQPAQGAEEAALAKASITALAAVADGAVYMGTSSGLFRTDRSGKSLARLTLPMHNPDEPIGALLADGNQLWIGGAVDGVWILDLTAGKDSVPIRPPGMGKLTDQRVEVLEKAPQGGLWIGTRNGLNLFDPVSQVTERILPTPADPLALSTGFITSLLTDGLNRLWVATSGGGINIMVGRDKKGQPRFRRLGIDDGLPDANVDKLLQDAAGNIWASTDAGLAVINPKTLVIRALGRADGVAIPGYWSNSGAVTAHGELLFGGAGGLTVVRPDRFKEWAYHPPVMATDITVGGKAVSASRFNRLRDGGTEPLIVAPNANSLAVEFTALDYSAPERNCYAYRLDGYDKTWIDTDPTRRLAAYSNLPPGDYRLRLRGSNRNGMWTAQELVLPIRVLPAWYQTWWMRMIDVLAAAAAIYTLVHARTRYLRQRQNELEQQVGQRSEALRQTNAILEHLGAIGQEITAHLDADAVFQAINRHVHALLNVTHLSILLLDEEGGKLQLAFGVEHGILIHPQRALLESDEDTAARCMSERREVLIDAEHTVNTDGQHPPKQPMLSRLFVPLTIGDQILGVMTIQSPQRHAYSEREQLIFRTLCAYGAIALDNAAAYRQVEATLKRLRETQAQLVQQEKMASLGTLTAGVAHEINNPANFAHVGAQGLSESLERFRSFLLQLAADDVDSAVTDSVNRHIDALSSQTDTIVEGTTRIKNLVLDLLMFSRLDQPGKLSVPIIDNLLSTVNLVRTQYLETTEIRCEINANPVMECWPTLLNQVFMNIIVNACQATRRKNDDTHRESPGVLTIRSSIHDDRWLAIEFDDQGCGIPADIIDRIFEPFFTTKIVGEGTGLGLSISFGIVEKHGGHIKVQSVEGQGTCITVMLPLD